MGSGVGVRRKPWPTITFVAEVIRVHGHAVYGQIQRLFPWEIGRYGTGIRSPTYFLTLEPLSCGDARVRRVFARPSLDACKALARAEDRRRAPR
jgi:hypothetical protein